MSDFYAPVSGEVIDVNASLPNDLEILGKDPFGDGWLVKIRPTDTAELDALLDQSGYDSLVKNQPH